jgi:LytS/YehU family sensor histidine kinase
VKIVDGSLRIVVHDDGEGTGLIDLEEMLAEGYGLRNVRDRLSTRYGPGEWFKFESSRETGTRVELVLPLSGAMGPEGRSGGPSAT